MRTPVIAALVVTVAAAAVTGPAERAAADIDCTPTITQSSVIFKAAPSILASKGSAKIAISALVAAPCGKPDGADLKVTAISSPVDIEHDLSWDLSSDVMPAGGSTYHLSTSVPVKAAQIHDVDAGSWDGYVGVADTDDPGEYGLTTYSDPVPINLRRATKITANATPEPVHHGKKITVHGLLTRASWDSGHDGVYAGQPVALQFRTKTGSYHTVKTAHTSSTGTTTAAVTAKHDGYYRFVFLGTSSSGPAVSAGDYVNVT